MLKEGDEKGRVVHVPNSEDCDKLGRSRRLCHRPRGMAMPEEDSSPLRILMTVPSRLDPHEACPIKWTLLSSCPKCTRFLG